MDSIVDAFFPIINFIEGESKDLDGYLADPLGDAMRYHSSPEEDATIVDRQRHNSKQSHRKVKVPQMQTYHSLPGPFRRFPLPAGIISFVPSSILQTNTRILVKHITLSSHGQVRREQYAYPSEARRLGEALGASLPFEPKQLVKRMGDNRKLVTGMTRLLAPKTDVVRGMRKRSRETGDMSMYLGDLQGALNCLLVSYEAEVVCCCTDHIVTMQQTLNFYEAILSHNHPVLVGILRLASQSAKSRNDKVCMQSMKLPALELTCFR